MALSTYAELKASIADWLNRTDLTTQIVDFIDMVETQANQRLSTLEMEATSALTLDSDSEASLPADYLKYRSVAAAGSPVRPLTFATPTQQDTSYPYRGSGIPCTFTIYDEKVRVMPKTTDTITFDYYQKIPVLSDGNTTNWLLDKNPNFYLFGALMHANIFLQNDQRTQHFGSLFETEFQNLESADVRAKHSNPVSRYSGAVA